MDLERFQSGRRFRGAAGAAGRRWAGACLIAFGALGAASARGADLLFPPGEQAGGAGRLAIGDSLRVGAIGLAPGAAADLRLRDPAGALVAELRGRADERGEIPLDLLWRRTGVVGCDCGAKQGAGTATFATFEEAERALAGTQWMVELIAADGTTRLAQRQLALEPTRGYQAYVSDAAGCPRSRMAPDEDVYLTFRGPEAPAGARIFLVADRPAWEEPVPFAEARGGVPPTGQLIEGAAPLSTLLLWPADPKGLRSGYFAVVVRTETENDRTLPLATDALLSHHPPGDHRSTEEGVRINDWDCGPPRH